jgi:hypothetical protein
MLWSKAIGAGGIVAGQEWSSDGEAVIAWYNPSNAGQIYFAAPANSINDYDLFQYALSTTWSDFNVNTYVVANDPVIWNGITYNGFVRSSTWTAGNPTYDQRVNKLLGSYLGYHYSGGETNALARNIYIGNKE